MAVMEGFTGFRLSSKGKRPVSSWTAITPAAQTSDAGVNWELSVSGAMNHGVPAFRRKL